MRETLHASEPACKSSLELEVSTRKIYRFGFTFLLSLASSRAANIVSLST
jgi:hypothetical protein